MEYEIECEECGFVWVSNSDDDYCPECGSSCTFANEVEQKEQS